MRVKGQNSRDTLPCRHKFPSHSIATAKEIITWLPKTNPELLAAGGIQEDDWPELLRAAIESMRGASSAISIDKRRFIHTILRYCQQQGFIESWSFVGSGGRQDYKIVLNDGTLVAVEAKGCPDGNNTTIWDRPSWANEFVVWCLCPKSLAHDPGQGVWSGANRLMTKIAAERKVVDAFLFWDGRCGTPLRQCIKQYGVRGELRSQATDLVGQAGKEDWLPPPCIYLFPRSWPSVPHNTEPPIHTVETCKFAAALLSAFNVPKEEWAFYVHETSVKARGTSHGTEIQVSTVSRCWPDGKERVVSGKWRPVKREA